jgi:CRISPR-associated protein Cas2
MRATYLVTYDISDAKRLRKIFKTMNGYGDHLQYSVFRCDLSDKERALMVADLDELLHHDEDQILIIHLGPAGERVDRRFTALGRKVETTVRRAVVV